MSITESVMAHLRRVIDGSSFDSFFAGLSFRAEDDCSVSVVAPTRYASERLSRLYKKDILIGVRVVFPKVTEVNFCVGRPGFESTAAVGAILNNAEFGKSSVAKMQPSKSGASSSHSVPKNGVGCFHMPDCRWNDEFRLENFRVGASNRIAYATAQTVVETPGKVYRILSLWGGNGLGKTHLLHGIGQGILDRKPDAKVVYIPCETFVNGYIAGVQNRKLDTFRAQFRSCDALLIDDFQFIVGKNKTQEELFHTLDSLRRERKQIVISANVSPNEMARLDPRLADFLGSGLVIKLDAPEFELRVSLVQSLAERRNWTLDAESPRILATHIEKSVSGLDGALCKMFAVARATGIETSAALALDILRDLGYLHSGPLTLKDILGATAKVLEIKPDLILSHKRDASIVRARHIGMHIAKHLTAHTVVEIGRFFGNRDHSTVLSALKKINDLMKREESVRQQLQQVRQLLGK